MGYDRLYFLKKAFAIYPGLVRPVSGDFLADHYRRRRRRRNPLRAAIDLAVGAGFRAWIPFRARTVQRKFGYDDGWRRRTIAIARERFADPNDIALFRIDDPAALDGYIRRFEDAALNKIVNPIGWTAGCALADKARFYERCLAHRLPHPEVIATLRDGRIEHGAEPGGRDLIAKPADGEGGDGVQMIGTFADRPSLDAELRRRFSTSGVTWIVQPRVGIHPDLADLALGALPTVRIVTILDEQGAPEVVSATLRFASDPAARVDNMKAGGLLSAVDLATGALGIACKGYGGGDYDTHPVTGAPIPGRRLPQWEESKSLVVRAHRDAFPDYVIIGWDVAMTEDGPSLIEGNGKPGVLMPQRAARRGLGTTRYGELLAYNLARAEQSGG